jgi:uncharacterized protein (TIGR02611 family)
MNENDIQKREGKPGLPKNVRRVLVAVAGGTVLLAGIALIVLPGPAILVIPAGLAILGAEFAWARRWLQAGREKLPKRFQNMSWQSLRSGLRGLLRQIQRSILPHRN